MPTRRRDTPACVSRWTATFWLSRLQGAAGARLHALMLTADTSATLGSDQQAAPAEILRPSYNPATRREFRGVIPCDKNSSD